MSHGRRLPRLLAAGMLLAPALALPLDVETTSAASAHANGSTDVDGAITYLVHSGIGHSLRRVRRGDGRTIQVQGDLSRTWV